VAVLALAAAAWGVTLNGDAAGAFRQAPPLKLPGLDGKEVEVKYGDARITLVNFWATWCLPCREEIPAIDRLFLKYRERGFRAAGVALQSGDPATVKDFLEERKIKPAYPILMGTEELAAVYGDIEIVPTTYLIGPGGEVLKTYFGVTADFEKGVGAEIEKVLGRTAALGAPHP